MTPFFSGEGAKYKQNSIKEHTKHIHAKNDCFDDFFLVFVSLGIFGMLIFIVKCQYN